MAIIMGIQYVHSCVNLACAVDEIHLGCAEQKWWTYEMRALIVLVAAVAFLLPTPGVILASSELVLSRNLSFGWIMLVACIAASITAVFWAFSALNVWKHNHGIWIVFYATACVIGFAASENMVFKFMM